jgi:hypothetical protein
LTFYYFYAKILITSNSLNMKSEKYPSPSSHADNDVYSAFCDMVGTNSRMAEKYLSDQQHILQSGPGEQRLEMDEFRKLQDELYAQKVRGEITLDQLSVKLSAIHDLREHTARFDRTARLLRQYDSRPEIQSEVESVDDIDAINDLMTRTASIGTLPSEGAPFKDYQDNTDRVWKYADDKSIRDYLLAKVFLDDQTLSRLHLNNAKSVTTITNDVSATSRYFDVPTNLIVSAAGFGSWAGRDDSLGNQGMGEIMSISLPGFLSTTKRSLSLQAIKAYASYPTELPPVTEMAVYIQPNGLAYAGNGSGDSHRISAAILRGQQTVKATNLSTVLLKDNYF